MPEIEVAPGETAEVRGGVIAYLELDGAVRAAEIFKRAFGAREVARAPLDDKGRTMHLHLYINGGSLMLCDAFPEHGHPAEKSAAVTLTLQGGRSGSLVGTRDKGGGLRDRSAPAGDVLGRQVRPDPRPVRFPLGDHGIGRFSPAPRIPESSHQIWAERKGGSAFFLF